MKNGLKVVVTFGKATVAVLVAMVAVVVVGEVKVVVEVEDEVDANVDANVEVLNVDVAGAEVVWCCGEVRRVEESWGELGRVEES